MFDPTALRAARLRNKRTLVDVAAAVGRDFSVISRYERGERAPNAATLAALVRELGIDARDLFPDRGGR